jgi:hypothetical protein
VTEPSTPDAPPAARPARPYREYRPTPRMRKDPELQKRVAEAYRRGDQIKVILAREKMVTTELYACLTAERVPRRGLASSAGRLVRDKRLAREAVRDAALPTLPESVPLDMEVTPCPCPDATSTC